MSEDNNLNKHREVSRNRQVVPYGSLARRTGQYTNSQIIHDRSGLIIHLSGTFKEPHVPFKPNINAVNSVLEQDEAEKELHKSTSVELEIVRKKRERLQLLASKLTTDQSADTKIKRKIPVEAFRPKKESLEEKVLNDTLEEQQQIDYLKDRKMRKFNPKIFEEEMKKFRELTKDVNLDETHTLHVTPNGGGYVKSEDVYKDKKKVDALLEYFKGLFSKRK